MARAGDRIDLPGSFLDGLFLEQGGADALNKQDEHFRQISMLNTDQPDDKLKPKEPDSRELKAQFEEEVSQLVDNIIQLTGTDLSPESFSPEISKTVTRLLDHVSNNILLDPM